MTVGEVTKERESMWDFSAGKAGSEWLCGLREISALWEANPERLCVLCMNTALREPVFRGG